MTPTPDKWIFAYGSLMWDPGFPYVEVQPGLIHGYHRAFCLYSWHYRGTRERPGLVLGLDRGGSCIGRAYRLAPEHEAQVLDYLHEREMLHYVYVPTEVPVRLPDRRRLRAHTYVVERANEQYAGKLTLTESARLIRQGHGVAGANLDYLESAVRHLDALGIRDGPLHALWKVARSGKA